MARQNIDEKWKEDPRKKALAKRIGERAANGMRVEVNWLLLDYKGQPIPLNVFQFVENSQDWIECGLAEVRGDMVHVTGADAYADFFDKQKANGNKPKKAKRSQVKRNEKTESQAKPNKPSFSISSSSSFSNSSSNSDLVPSEPTKASAFVRAYCDRFKARWGENPQILGKDAGIAKRLAKDLGQDRFEYLLDAFFQMPDAWLVKVKHPLAALETKLNEIVVFAESGQFTTQRQVRDADNSVSNAMLLAKVQRGEI